MLGLLAQILCWIKQFGALMLNALIDGFNAILHVLFALAVAAINAWPIGMPSLPDMPDQVHTAFGWIAWSPFPSAALLAFGLFCITVYAAMFLGAPILRWLKIID